MTRTAFLSVSVSVVGLGIAGCELNQAGGREVAAVWERHEELRAAQAEQYAETPALHGGRIASAPAVATRPAASQPVAGMEAPTRLRDYIVLALKDNPDIHKAEEVARAKSARIPQVTALPDPMLNTKTLPDPVETAAGNNYFILGVSQKLPVPEKLDRAGRIALEETRMAIADWEQMRLRVIADVKRAYFQLYIIDKTVQITRENEDLLRSLIDVARGQVAAGRRTQEDVLRAQVELSSLDAKIIELQQQRVTAEAMLNTMLNRSPTTAVPAPPEFVVRKLDAKLEDLFAQGIKANPELERFQRQIERDRQAVKLAGLAYWPDFTVGFEWMLMEPRAAFRPPPNPMTGQRPAVSHLSEEGRDAWAITFGFNVPIWVEKIEAGVREAKRNLAASTHGYVSARNQVYFRIEDALANVRAQRELAELFDSTIIPQARQTFEVSQAGYTSGVSDFLYVIDNWQKWLTFTIMYHRALGELERSVADLELAIGMSLTEAGASP